MMGKESKIAGWESVLKENAAREDSRLSAERAAVILQFWNQPIVKFIEVVADGPSIA